ncbi:MAG: precorrin-3B C(17)-methyltransferase [Oscillospiraceae bacterium]|nr:precorrin-3B C(17)-methyltransferase [Oscillospiraceae bacterium]
MGTLYVVGLGPGDPAYLTDAAKAALSKAEVICGYTLYVELIRPLYPEKEVFTTAMTGEIERCRHALALSEAGRDVAMVCSGDAGVYGMAAPVLTLKPDYPNVTVEIIPGVTAALSGAALLGAPLGHDFCVISLSDRLTDWAVIQRRLECAAAGDFAVCLYNPASRHRQEHLRRACEILLQSKSPDTVCGMVQNIGRTGESVRVLTLSELCDAEADMFTTVFIGSSRTQKIGSHIVTPRGYRL